jgi:hypothetical protein
VKYRKASAASWNRAAYTLGKHGGSRKQVGDYQLDLIGNAAAYIVDRQGERTQLITKSLKL